MDRNRYVEENTARMEKILKTSAENGLSREEAAARLQKNGRNRIFEKRRSPVIDFFAAVFHKGSLPLFLLALIIAFPLLKKDVLFPSILYLVFLSVLLLLFVLRERLLCVHETSLLPYVKVIRGGRERAISPESLTEGDLLVLSPGDVLYTYAHVTTDSEMEVVCEREGKHKVYIKHGGDCFEECEESYNLLCPGDKIRSGNGRAFVTHPCEPRSGGSLFAADTLKSRGTMCVFVTRITYILAFLLLLFAFLRACALANSAAFTALGESLLLSAILVSTASTAFYPLLFDLLFLIRNRRGARTDGVSFASPEDARTVAGVDAFVIPTRAMFSMSGFDVKYFETAGGRRITEKMRGSAELALIAECIFASKERCSLSAKEAAALRFCGKNASSANRLTLCARSTSGDLIVSSYRELRTGSAFSIVAGEASMLIDRISFVCENEKMRALDATRRAALFATAKELQDTGYSVYFFAEATALGLRAEDTPSLTDLRLLGFFAMRRAGDTSADAAVRQLAESERKVLFVHEGESAEWLTREIPSLADAPILDGESENFRTTLTYFVKDDLASMCIGVRLSPKQKAQVVAALEAEGKSVAAWGSTFSDHRMMYDATVSFTPAEEEAKDVPPLLAESSAVRAREHISSCTGAVQNATQLLGAFGIFSVALCASLLGRAVILFFGALFGNTFLACGYYAFFGVLFDILAFFCFSLAEKRRTRFGDSAVVRYESERNTALFVGFVLGAVVTALIASFVRAVRATPESFVFLSLLLMLNVGIWYFSLFSNSVAVRLYSFVSTAVAVLLFLIHDISGKRLGLPFDMNLLFWALLPVVTMVAAGKVLEICLTQGINLKIGDKNERM